MLNHILNLSTTIHVQQYELDAVLLQRNRKLVPQHNLNLAVDRYKYQLVSYSSNYKNQSFIMKNKRNNNSNA